MMVVTLTFASLSAASAAASSAQSTLKHRFDADCAPGGVGIILAWTPESRSAFVATIVPEFDGNSRMTSIYASVALS